MGEGTPSPTKHASILIGDNIDSIDSHIDLDHERAIWESGVQSRRPNRSEAFCERQIHFIRSIVASEELRDFDAVHTLLHFDLVVAADSEQIPDLVGRDVHRSKLRKKDYPIEFADLRPQDAYVHPDVKW